MKWKGYEVKEEPIGKGFSGHVFLAKDASGRTVAIKRMADTQLASHEAGVMRAYGKHRFLPELYDFFMMNNQGFLVMEYIRGKVVGTGDYQVKGQTYAMDPAVRITLNVLHGLKHLHQSGFHHRDLLPKNIMIADNDPDTVKIIDFGLSRPVSEGRRSYCKNSDVYKSVFLCIYLLQGQASNNEESLKSNDMDGELREILLKGIDKRVENQYGTARELIEALERVIH